MTDKIINWEKTLTLCHDNNDLANELIAMLKSDLPRQKQILLHAYDKQDTQMIRDIVHQILGSCSYISLPTIEATARQMHHAIHTKANNIDAQKKKLIDAIDSAIIYSLPK